MRNRHPLWAQVTPPISDIEITANGIKKLMNGINPNKASGPDNIPCRVLKELAEELSPILAALFNQSLSTGELPSDWKQAHVAPIFKKGNQHDPANYRPVSLTCVVCKMLEHVICKHVLNHLEDHGILSKYQHGFRKHHSCETQLLLTLHDLQGYRNERVQVDMAVLDFAKAFDTFPHRRLMNKLSHYGIQGHLHKWIFSFLSQRTQRIRVDGELSEEAQVLSGVPQGTVLGPLLFLLFINDLPHRVSSQVRLFADDCLIYRPIHSHDDCVKLQKDLDALKDWGDMWGMRFNEKKCNIMRIACSKSPFVHLYELNSHTLEQVKDAKYLGVTISEDLTWANHITSTVNKANSTLGFL